MLHKSLKVPRVELETWSGTLQLQHEAEVKNRNSQSKMSTLLLLWEAGFAVYIISLLNMQRGGFVAQWLPKIRIWACLKLASCVSWHGTLPGCRIPRLGSLLCFLAPMLAKERLIPFREGSERISVLDLVTVISPGTGPNGT